MATLERFSEKERGYHPYQARQNYLRVQYDIELELKQKTDRHSNTHVQLPLYLNKKRCHHKPC